MTATDAPIKAPAAKRNAANRRKGKAWEYDLRVGLRDLGYDTEALRLTGAKDEGDLVIRDSGRFIVIEAKNARLQPGEFVRQALLEADHFAENRRLDRADVYGIAVVKRANLNWKQAFVITTLDEYLGLL